MSRKTFFDRRVACLAACAALLLGAVPAAAQDAAAVAREWRVMPVFGATVYDDASALNNAAFFGGEVAYPLTEFLSLGGAVSFARPEVDGTQFPLALFQISSDSLFLFQVGQQTTQVTYAALATVGMNFGRARVYGQGGVGGYSFWLDPQSNSSLRRIGADDRFGGLMIPVGAGLSVDIGTRTAVRLNFRDEIFTSFDRDKLHTVEPRFFNDCSDHHQGLVVCFPELNPVVSEESSIVHNLRFSLGFEFIPGN